MYVDLNTLILLQTANASVPRIHQLHSVVTMHILFDSGSQRSYISERAKEKLGLFPKRKEKLLIKTFGQEDEDVREWGIVIPSYRPSSLQSLGESSHTVCSTIIQSSGRLETTI